MTSEHHTNPLFVVGCPRSGTTLTASILAHSPWGVPFETHYIPKLVRRLRYTPRIETQSQWRKAIACIASERAIQQRLGPITRSQLLSTLDKLSGTLRDASVAALIDTVGRLARKKEGAESWADKTPWYVLELSTIHSLFPSSKILHVVRDGRDVACSLLRKPWGPHNIFSAATYWRKCVEAAAACEHLVSSDVLLHVRYEDLLSTPEQEIARIEAFLNFDIPNDIRQQWISGLNKHNHKKWQKLLTSRQVATFESIAGHTLTEWEYAEHTSARTQPISPIARCALTLHDRVLHLRHLVYMNTVEAVQIRWHGKQPFAE